jgi:hypothetical protein
MPKLPFSFSIRSIKIEAAIKEGRTEDALDALVDILSQGKADGAVQKLAANWIKTVGIRAGDPKALRDGKKESLKEWIAIADMVLKLQRDGKTYKEAEMETAAYFGYGERHVQKCVARMNKILKEQAAQK